MLFQNRPPQNSPSIAGSETSDRRFSKSHSPMRHTSTTILIQAHVVRLLPRYCDKNTRDCSLWQLLPARCQCIEQLLKKNNSSDIWTPVERLKLFWQHCRSVSAPLAQLAHRIYSTPANSIPSERSFSTMNYIIDKFRASIDVERSNEATFVYVNSKAHQSCQCRCPNRYRSNSHQPFHLMTFNG